MYLFIPVSYLLAGHVYDVEEGWGACSVVKLAVILTLSVALLVLDDDII